MIKFRNECRACGKPTYGHLSKLCKSCRKKISRKEIPNDKR